MCGSGAPLLTQRPPSNPMPVPGTHAPTSPPPGTWTMLSRWRGIPCKRWGGKQGRAGVPGQAHCFVLAGHLFSRKAIWAHPGDPRHALPHPAHPLPVVGQLQDPHRHSHRLTAGRQPRPERRWLHRCALPRPAQLWRVHGVERRGGGLGWAEGTKPHQSLQWCHDDASPGATPCEVHLACRFASPPVPMCQDSH